MKTAQLYLDNSYEKEMDAEVLEVVPEGRNRYRLLLDQTVFYPMGGGQPTDQGKLDEMGVYQTLTKDGEIWHCVETQSEAKSGMNVHGVIDWNRRYKNMRVHSAGHVVDFAMYQLGYSPKPLYPTKGDHGKKPYIIYTGILEKDIREKLEEKSNELVEKNLKFTTSFVSLTELEKQAIYLQPGLPSNKPLRMLTLEGVGSVADGGTQVKMTFEIGHISIPEISHNNTETTIVYRLL